jgi:hypothetical protein
MSTDDLLSTAPTTQPPEGWAAVAFAPQNGQPHLDVWKHTRADALHHWTDHARLTGAPMQLSRTDYDAAVVAALASSIHLPALSPFAAHPVVAEPDPT